MCEFSPLVFYQKFPLVHVEKVCLTAVSWKQLSQRAAERVLLSSIDSLGAS